MLEVKESAAEKKKTASRSHCPKKQEQQQVQQEFPLCSRFQQAHHNNYVFLILAGLDESMKGYLYEFSKQEIGGRALLNIRPYELENLGMLRIGHQEIVLEAVENLRNFVRPQTNIVTYKPVN